MAEDFSAELERQKLEALKELAYGASHEINNPLANIAARAQTLLRDEQVPERRRSLEAIHQQAMRAHEMISDLMLFARPPQLALEKVDLCELVRQLVQQRAAELRQLSIALSLDVPDEQCDVSADRQQLMVALDALCRNSAEAIGSDGQIKIAVRPHHRPHMHAVEVTDSGSGISAEVRLHMFDPFYSGREAGRGLGFGLSKCWRIITDHGGEVLVGDQPASGAQITLLLPIHPPREP